MKFVNMCKRVCERDERAERGERVSCKKGVCVREITYTRINSIFQYSQTTGIQF
jgi:hypothetical protein